MAEQTTVQSVERAFSLIELLSSSEEMSIKELSEGSGLHKSTVFRLLSTLVQLGYVTQNRSNEHYRLSLKFLGLSSAILDKCNIMDIVRPYLRRLSDECSETVHLVQRSGNNVVYIGKFESRQNSIRMVSRVGMSLPMPFTAVGKAIMAELSDAEIETIWKSCRPGNRTEHTITDFSLFMDEIAQVRAEGYAVDNQENEEGVFCLATVLPNITDEAAYAFSISAPIQRVSDEVLNNNVRLLMDTRKLILKNM